MNPHTSILLRVSVIAAVLATAGDLLLLWNANAYIPDLALASPPIYTLFLGHYLGITGLALLGLGYLAIGREALQLNRKWAMVLIVTAIIFSIVGPLIHGMTSTFIYFGSAGTQEGNSAMEGILESGLLLLPLWGIGLIDMTLLSIACAKLAGNRWLAVLNPIVLTLIIGSLAMIDDHLAAFGQPASVNIAHLIFLTFVAPSIVRNIRSRLK